MRTSRRFLPFLLLPALLVAACGDDGDEDVASDGAGDPPATVPEGASPGGLAGDVFLSIEHVGGFVPVGFDFASVPAVTVYADGTVVVPGATTAIFPGPAVAPLATGTLDDGALDELLDAVAEAGLLAEVAPDPGENPLVADAATTRITVVVDGRDTVVEAYALELPVDDGVEGITDEQREVRDRLNALVTDVTAAATAAAVDLYEPVGYRVLTTAPIEGDPGVEPNELTWPAQLPQPSLDECLAVTGDAAATLTPLLADATQITRWLVGSEAVSLSVRPMLPHEQDC